MINLKNFDMPEKATGNIKVSHCRNCVYIAHSGDQIGEVNKNLQSSNYGIQISQNKIICSQQLMLALDN